MAEAAELIGRRYSELPATALFRDTPIPAPEQIEDQSYVSLPDKGISLVLPDNQTVGAVQLYGQGHQGFSAFGGELPGGVAFGMDRSAVRAKLGAPDKQGEEKKVPILGDSPAWDSFVTPEGRVHVQYGLGGGGVQLVTLSPA